MKKLKKGQKADMAIVWLLENAAGSTAAEAMFEHAALLSYFPDDREVATEAIQWFGDRADVKDGSYGEPVANDCMQCEAEIRSLWGIG